MYVFMEGLGELMEREEEGPSVMAALNGHNEDDEEGIASGQL